MTIVTKEWAKKFEEAEYLEDILRGLEEIQKENNYSDEEMDKDLEVALWRAYVYNNMDTYEYYELAERTLAKVKDEGIKNGIWCYRYSCALVYLRRFDEALEYSRLGTKVEPNYPWGWLQLGRLCYKYNLLDEAFNAIDKGLELVPNDYEFLTLKDDIENDRGYAYTNSHYIDEEVDKNLKERLINIDDDELYQSFVNKNDLEKELEILNKQNKNQEIIDLITSLPKDKLDYNILGKLARAYNNNNQCEKGLEVLLSLKDEGENDSLWNFRVGYAYYYSEKVRENPEYLEKAKNYFEKCLELNPNEPDGDTLLMLVYSDLGNKKLDEEKNDEALEYFKKARDLAKNNNDILSCESILAWAYDYIGEYENGYKHLQTIISLGRDDSWLHSELGFCLSGMGKLKKAILEFKKAVKMGREDGWIFERIGVAYQGLEEYEKALKYYLKGFKVDPENIYLISEIAWIYNNPMADLEKGLEFLNKAKDLGRDDIWLNSEIGFCLNRVGTPEDALVYLNRAIELGRDDSWILIEKGLAFKGAENYEEALKNFLEAEKLDKNNKFLSIEISECLDFLGRIDEAIQRLHMIIATDKDYNKSVVNSQLGYLYGRKNNSEEALKYLFEAEKAGRNDIWLYSEIGWDLMTVTEYEKALEYFSKAIKLGRDDIWINGQVAFSLSRLNRIQEAIRYFEKARFMDSNDDWVAYQLATCYRKAGEIEKALNLLKPLLEKSAFKGWVEFELAWCYALFDEKEEAKKYLKEADMYVGGDIVSSSELQNEYDTIKKLISTKTYFA